VSDLVIVVDGESIGRIRAERSGRLTLEYEARWQQSPAGYSLSANLRRAQATHPHRAVVPYLWNLLPENPNVLQRWAQQYHVSAANPFKLLAHVGADVPGAAQFVPEEQAETIRAQNRLTVQWLTADQLAERLRRLRADVAAVRLPGDLGKMSLPGAQAKTAFYWDESDSRWGVPSGRTPTTHIIKPCIPGFDGLVENEHLCQDVASRLGLPAARSSVLTLDHTYIVVERYDRLSPPRGSRFPIRIHQEDMCQALGLMPSRKYQEDGGPGVSQIADVIRHVSSDGDVDVERFVRANQFNWLIGGTDGHAKNYSLLISAGDEFRLAPLYDLSSQLPYPALIRQRVAMRVGEHYEIARVGAEDWRKLARACAIDEERVSQMLAELAAALPAAISAARDAALTDGLAEEIVVPLSRQLTAHVRARLDSLASGSGKGRRPLRS
jgi:serine/threonine-protein kinase HipA